MNDNYNGLGRRKEANARVYLKEGTGQARIRTSNGKEKSLHDYFYMEPSLCEDILRPLKLFNKENDFDFFARVKGSGSQSQAGAIRLALARALLKVSPEYKITLKNFSLLTRDPRRVWRKVDEIQNFNININEIDLRGKNIDKLHSLIANCIEKDQDLTLKFRSPNKAYFEKNLFDNTLVIPENILQEDLTTQNQNPNSSLEATPRKLEETVLREEGIKEKYIQNLFKENLAEIFDLTYLTEEHYLINPDTGEKDCKTDSLALSKSGRYFVVIEYKRDESLELYEQAAEYISCLKDTKNPECIHNEHELIRICIATEVHKRLRHHQRPDEQKDENIKIIEIKFYDDRKILYIDTSNLPEWLTIASNRKDIKEKGKLSGGTSQTNANISDEAEKWLAEVENSIFSLKPLERSDWKKGNLHRISPQEISQILESLLDKYGIRYSEKEHGVGNSYWYFSIESETALKELKNFFQEYREKFPESSEMLK
ncbi:3354_t:CDS:2 [Racocetra persica]|uniref:3354_t:CDS:1 n=1 Tax=Racocetra persica TaxID=160502 RepID=A0ACA9KNZ8_9GLOM|nr:3354_t:CDS:2 [Racocetra persica]